MYSECIMRTNEYKKLILAVMEKNHLLSLAEIHAQIPDAHFASIYRNVESLCEKGVLKKVTIDKNNTQYEMASHGHGHFVCNDCNTVEEMEVPESIKGARASVSDMLVRGKCEDCIK